MKKKGGIIAAVLGVLLLVVGGVLLLLSGSKKTNKELYTEAIQKSLGLTEEGFENEKIEKGIKEIVEKLEKNIYKISINGEVTQDEASYGNLDGALYFGKDQFYLKMDASSNDKTINLESMLKDSKIYVSMKNILSKVYYIDGLDELLAGSKNVTENTLFNKVVNYLVESFKDVIKEEDVKVDKTEININGKSYKANQYGYTFSGNTLYDVVKSFIEKVKNDKTIIEEINKVVKDSGLLEQYGGDFNISRDDFSSLLDQALNAASSLKELGNLATITVYMYDDEPISRQISVNIPSGQGNMNVPISIADFKAENYYKLSISSMGMEVYKLEIKGKNDKSGTISFSAMGEEIVKGTYKNEDGNYEFKIESASSEQEGAYILIKINKNGTGSIEAKSDSSNASITYEIEEVSEIPDMDVSNSVSFEEMTEEDKEILQRFLNPVVYINEKNSIDSSANINVRQSCKIVDGKLVCNEV